MKKRITTTLLCSLLSISAMAQWKPTTPVGEATKSSHVRNYYELNINMIKDQLKNAQETGSNAKPVQISLPTLDGKVEKFAVYSFPVVVKELADQYGLGSYVGVGIDDPSKFLRFSVASNDFQSMIIKNGKSEFIEPVNAQKTVYGVHPKTDKSKEGFLCSMNEDLLSKQEIDKLYKSGAAFTNQATNFAKASDKKYRTLRLAMSVTGEYTQFHGGTVTGALAAINATLTRVNGVFEKDFALHLNLQNFPGVIYTNPATDPYSAAGAGAGGAWTLELQNTLTANVGNDNYDIGHLFGASGGGGNAGCIGCVCINPTASQPKGKGSGYTSPANSIPQGDSFDIDYVAHEFGHQLGANHTFSHGLEGTGVNVEPGSGSTIMGYAGITGPNTDVQPHSDDYFHIASIKQVQANLINKTCDVETTVANNPPVIAVLPTYNIPKGTAFVLTASATDAENDPITYSWEEVDNASVTINKNNLGTTATGASFRSGVPSTNPTRYFPKFSSVLAGTLDNSLNTWESVSMVPRTTKFSVAVRDNNPIANQQQTQFAEQTIVVGNDGPFKINSMYAFSNAPTPITWDVANTTAAPYSVANVKIDYTTDNGTTWTVLSASTANDGSETYTFPASLNGQTIKLRVASIGNVFYAVRSMSVITLAPCDGTAPSAVTVNTITTSSAVVNWAPVNGATYSIRYKKSSATTWSQTTSPTNSVTLNGLEVMTMYDVQVAAICSGTTGTYSATTQFTTLSYCALTSASPSDEYISNVTLANLNNTSGPSTYTNYTTDPTKTVTLVKGSTNNMVSVTKTWTGTLYNEGVRVWIDFNKDGVFDATEMVMSSSPSQVPTVTSTFTVPVSSVLNSPLRMRVALRYNTLPQACTSYDYGEVEDYNVVVTDVLAVTDVNASNNGIQMYPNPTSEILNITKVSDKAAYKIYNAAGQLVGSGNIRDGKVNVSSLVTGAYVIAIDDKGKDVFKSKFVKK
ncbi:propanediol utilization protein [Chryseobacterium piperi]|uniref:Propanediol utilization protein n=1 Tax=Chryseobacterium piperi TaxID=558152 RepID=A0A086BLX4_9FLAO|nr:zinc-dependent metalloprotease family protein [Chryseobacterium piperi]ASW76516.1 T9SS C-terminal target domain-containing protein [Chryseobacterium piperi]KFF29938.1 propanediol utilization protein [Chryseobacterium piperi]